MIVEEGLFDPVRQSSGQRRGALEHLQTRLLGPAGQVRDAVGAGVQADGLAGRPRHRLGDQLALGVVQRGRALIDGDQRVGELPGGLGAVDEPPQPLDRLSGCSGVAVVDPQRARSAVFARFGDVGAELLDDEADPGDGEPGDAVAGLGVGRVVVVSPQEGVDELCRPLDYADQPSP